MIPLLENAWQNASDFLSFVTLIKSLHAEEKVTGNNQTQELLAYSKLNEKRMDRILKHGHCDWSQVQVKAKKWLVITEGWCGDSAQITPYLYLCAQQCGAELRVVLRDENPEIMDLFLTNGTRSIPIIVFVDAEGAVVGQWGPRPQILAGLVKDWKEQGLTKETFNPLIHKWYADDKGQACMHEWRALIG